jgi:hypothetical protein
MAAVLTSILTTTEPRSVGMLSGCVSVHFICPLILFPPLPQMGRGGQFPQILPPRLPPSYHQGFPLQTTNQFPQPSSAHTGGVVEAICCLTGVHVLNEPCHDAPSCLNSPTLHPDTHTLTHSISFDRSLTPGPHTHQCPPDPYYYDSYQRRFPPILCRLSVECGM